jgi:cell division control protein 6
LDDLKSDVKSSLSDKSIQFDPYDSPELFDVLKQRSDDAFLPGAVDDGILRHCAAIGADNGGDARKAIEMVRESADISRAEDADEVLSDHVRRAKEQLQSEEVITSISSLSQNEKITLYALVTLTADGSEKPRSRRVYERYEKLAESGGERSVRYRTVRYYLAELDTLQITNRDGENGGPDGNYRTHELNEQVSVEEAVNELSGVIKICGVHTSIEDVPTAPDTL